MSASGWGRKYLKCMSVRGCMHGREGVVWRSAVEWHAMIAAVCSTMALDLGLYHA
jgi:hypothetical protein